VLDGAHRLGAKILVSGGSRCNVTNARVTDADFWGGRRPAIRRVLRGFTVAETVAFFTELGVPLHEENDGKLFPNTNRSRDVLNALITAATGAGVTIVTDARVRDVLKVDNTFRVTTSAGDVQASKVVLATGGRSLPKSGSDGAGFEIAKRLGHRIVPTTPALVPLLLDAERSVHRELGGVAHDAELTLWIDRAVDIRLRGSLLWTHFGVSGPVTLDMSRHWLRAELERRHASLSLSFCPGQTFDDVDRWWTTSARERPQVLVATQLATLIPASVADALARHAAIPRETMLAHLSRDNRRRLSHTLVNFPLPVTGDRGYTYAEATAGGVSLDEIDPSTMRSRVCDGLSLVGEILDVDGRIGGFNFQWAWSTARVAARALGP
jgi:predicted Rossmann fold flavoprotein